MGSKTKSGVICLLLLASVLFATMGALGQSRDIDNTTVDENMLGGLMCLSGVFCIIPLVFFILWIFVLVWVYKDAEKRGKSGALWLIICLVGGIIGLVIWFVVRPPILPQGGYPSQYPPQGGYPSQYPPQGGYPPPPQP